MPPSGTPTGFFNSSDTDNLWSDDAKTTHPTNGIGVFKWDDEQAGVDRMLERDPTAYPWVSAGINGLGSIDSNASSRYRARNKGDTADVILNDFLNNNAWTFFASFLMDADASNSGNMWVNTGLICDVGAFWGLHAKTDTGINTMYAYTWDGAAKSVGQAFLQNVPNVVRARYDGTNIYVKLNDNAETSVASGNIQDVTNPVIVLSSTGFIGWPGMIGEILLYDSNLSAGDLTATMNYMMNRWVRAGGGGKGAGTGSGNKGKGGGGLKIQFPLGASYLNNNPGIDVS